MIHPSSYLCPPGSIHTGMDIMDIPRVVSLRNDLMNLVDFPDQMGKSAFFKAQSEVHFLMYKT
jgi:hypothetical protein